ncbi:hypothetical protein As57867_011623, partial [Aphanomyces stellatus]
MARRILPKPSRSTPPHFAMASSYVHEYAKSFEFANCTGSVLYLAQGSDIDSGYGDMTCAYGLSIDSTPVPLTQYVVNQTYMDIARWGLIERTLDNTCVIGGLGGEAIRASCATQTYTYYTDAACTKAVQTFEPWLPTVTCWIPNPLGGPVVTQPSSPLLFKSYLYSDCSGGIMFLAQGDIFANDPPQPCTDGFELNDTHPTAVEYLPSTLYMNFTSSLFDGVIANQYCLSYDGDNYYVYADCMTMTTTLYSDSSCATVDTTEKFVFAPVEGNCTVLNTAPPTELGGMRTASPAAMSRGA